MVKNKKLYFRGIFSLTQQFYDNLTSCVISQKSCRLFRREQITDWPKDLLTDSGDFKRSRKTQRSEKNPIGNRAHLNYLNDLISINFNQSININLFQKIIKDIFGRYSSFRLFVIYQTFSEAWEKKKCRSCFQLQEVSIKWLRNFCKY